MPLVEYILQKIESIQSKGKTKLIAIDGRGGSGKSSLASTLITLAPSFKIVPVDAFPCAPEDHPWHPLGTQTWVNWKRLRDAALLPLASGEDAKFLRTPWWKGQPSGPIEIVAWGGTVIVEGCYSLRRELRDLYDLRIWVEGPVDEAVENAIRRDGEAVRQSWTEAYAPNETAYIESHNPQAAADLVVLNSGSKRFELIKEEKAHSDPI